jgi:hypothetical protein
MNPSTLCVGWGRSAMDLLTVNGEMCVMVRARAVNENKQMTSAVEALFRICFRQQELVSARHFIVQIHDILRSASFMIFRRYE